MRFSWLDLHCDYWLAAVASRRGAEPCDSYPPLALGHLGLKELNSLGAYPHIVVPNLKYGLANERHKVSSTNPTYRNPASTWHPYHQHWAIYVWYVLYGFKQITEG